MSNDQRNLSALPIKDSGGCRLDGKSRPCDEYPACGCTPKRYARPFPTSTTKPVRVKR